MHIDNVLEGKKHIHFIGIGGSGMYPLAQILHEEGYYLTGSDNNETETLAAVRSMGIPVTLGQRAENIEGADLIVHTAAIMADNPELIAAKASGVPVIERSVLLGLLSQWYDRATCVCGTHGKTTVTSMISQVTVGAGVDPTCVVGGKLKAIGGSGRVGKSDVMVVEACEFVDTFLKLSPDISVILNIDADHLDYFKTVDNIIKSFHKFAEMTTDTVIVNGDNVRSMKAVEGISAKLITFGNRPANDFYPENIQYLTPTHSTFDLMYKGKKVVTLEVNIPGKHNILNAVAAAVACLKLGVEPEAIATELAKFRGAGRRFEILGHEHGVTIADDYAHHPAELKVTLETAKGMGFHSVWAVFQPFTFSRTYLLLEDFVSALQIADHVVLSQIMGSREKNTYDIYSSDIGEKIDGCVWFDTFEEITDHIVEHAQEGDLVITLGCGDIYKAAKMILHKLQEK